MFKYRARVKYSGNHYHADEVVTGYYWFDGVSKQYIKVIEEDGLGYGTVCRIIDIEIIPESLAISTGIKDISGVEIFSSFEVDGVMSKGGDVLVSEIGNIGNVIFEVGRTFIRYGKTLCAETNFLAKNNSFEIIGTQGEKCK